MHKVAATKKKDPKKSIIVVPSKVQSGTPATDEDFEGIEETEIAAQISLPAEGGWGWVVVAASFLTIFLLDGVFFTFGSIYHDMVDDLGVSESMVALINSIAVAMYFTGGPLVSALINRFGFRACTMCGSALGSFALLSTYFAVGYGTILVLYGFIGGFGACLASMSSGLVVGFYFERLRSLALSIATTGSSVGIMIMFTVNTTITNLAGWRVTTLLHSGLLGIIYFLGMTYRPLVSLTVTKSPDIDGADRTRTVTYLPSLAAIKSTPSGTKREGVMPSAAERLFSAVSNAHFPTAAAVVDEGVVASPTPNQPGPSTQVAASRLTLTAHGPQSGVSRRQLLQVQSIISKTSVPDKDKKNVEVNLKIEHPPEKRKWWQRCCHWEEHVPQSRPLYRDDAFYEGNLEQLPAYQKSMVDTAVEARTGLEYQMAVSRAVTAAELTEKRGVFTTAVRRILATMMDPKLLKRLSFLLLCFSGFFTYLGYLVPYVFLPDRNKAEGIDPEHCSVFVSVIGFANAMGRLIIGALACKYNPLRIYLIACLMAGVGIIAFNLSFNLYYQYAICVLFGFHIACLSGIRSMVIVQLFGLDMLTNATGMVLLFQGLGSLISTPISSMVKNTFGYAVSFYLAGTFVLISGFILLPVKKINEREQNKGAQGAQQKKENKDASDKKQKIDKKKPLKPLKDQIIIENTIDNIPPPVKSPPLFKTPPPV